MQEKFSDSTNFSRNRGLRDCGTPIGMPRPRVLAESLARVKFEQGAASAVGRLIFVVGRVALPCHPAKQEHPFVFERWTHNFWPLFEGCLDRRAAAA